MSLTFSSSVSNFHSCTLQASGPKRSFPPTDITRRQSLSRCGRATVGESKTERRRSIWRWVNSSVAVTPESWAMICASRAIELALWMRSSTNEMSFWMLWGGGITDEFQDLLLEIVDSYHWSSGHGRGMGSPGCESFQPRRTLWDLWVLDFWYRRGLWRTEHERRGCVKVPSFGHRGRNLVCSRKFHRDETFIPRILHLRRPFVSCTWFRRRTMLIEGQGTIYYLMNQSLWGGHWRCSLSCFFFISLEVVRPHGNGSSLFGREEETLMSDDSSVWDNIRLVRSWYAAVHASFSRKAMERLIVLE